MKAMVFCPAHITGFFEICYDENGNKIGSKGAGLSITKGSYAEVMPSRSVKIEGNVGRGEVTKEALKILGVKAKVKIKNELPFSQGFGISASASLAACLAACHIYGIEERRGVKAAHEAEIKMATGLGDVVAAYKGGLEIRKGAGVEGVEKIECRKQLFIAVVGEKIETRKVLLDEKMAEKINEVGRECIKEFISSPSLDKFFELSLHFSLATGLASGRMKKLLEKANKIGKAAMCMLGNSIIATGGNEMRKFLSSYKNYECFIDNEGARILATFFP